MGRYQIYFRIYTKIKKVYAAVDLLWSHAVKFTSPASYERFFFSCKKTLHKSCKTFILTALGYNCSIYTTWCIMYRLYIYRWSCIQIRRWTEYFDIDKKKYICIYISRTNFWPNTAKLYILFLCQQKVTAILTVHFVLFFFFSRGWQLFHSLGLFLSMPHSRATGRLPLASPQFLHHQEKLMLASPEA